MRFLDLFKKKREERSIEQLKWNKIWDLWAKKKAISPYAELMTYESEINNGGHAQFFANVSNIADLSNMVATLYTVLGDVLKENLKKAYNAHLESVEADETIDEILDECDNVFYENDREIEALLWEYANTIQL